MIPAVCSLPQMIKLAEQEPLVCLVKGNMHFACVLCGWIQM